MLSTLAWGEGFDKDTYHQSAEDVPPELIGEEETSLERNGKRKVDRSGRAVDEKLWSFKVLEELEKSKDIVNVQYRKSPMLHNPQYPTLDWDNLPPGVDCSAGKLSVKRAERKRQQVDNLLSLLQPLIKDGDRVVEFCGSSGYVVLPLAHLFPRCEFILLDRSHMGLTIAAERIRSAGLTNVRLFEGYVDDFMENFNVGVALHACGEASDMVMEKCLASKAAYVLAPCCVGKIQHSTLVYPRSAAVRAKVSNPDFCRLSGAADMSVRNPGAVRCPEQRERISRYRLCKSVVERDRNMRAEEEGYSTLMCTMHPITVTPKNDMIAGWPVTSKTPLVFQSLPVYDTRSAVGISKLEEGGSSLGGDSSSSSPPGGVMTEGQRLSTLPRHNKTPNNK